MSRSERERERPETDQIVESAESREESREHGRLYVEGDGLASQSLDKL